MANIPERTCIACRKKGSKDNFIKIVKNKNNELQIEKDKKLDGRGAYMCKSQDCLKLCQKSRALNRVFKMLVPQEFYEELNNEFDNFKN
jgi:predicted RNA-binding protein YlxR (DUF448 family)